MASYHVIPIPCLSDNYAYLVVDNETNDAAVVDASEAGPVIAAAHAARVHVRAIWSTHHHPDHVGGNEEVARELGIHEIAGHASDRGRIPGQTRFLETGDEVSIGTLRARALHIPGHTLGAVAYIIDRPNDGAVFTGDTLFLAGCGRLFEGTPAQMHASLTSLAELADSTRVYCGHEYTSANLRFAAHVEPSNAAVAEAAREAQARRGEGGPTVPGTILREKATNPFLRVREAEIRKTLGIASDLDDVAAFAAVRSAKDTFR
jgi:hydroxyacylglutathione hydrolase